MSHTFPVLLQVEDNENLICEITEHWCWIASGLFVTFCDFWTSHTKKLGCTKFQLDRSFRPEVIKENVNSK